MNHEHSTTNTTEDRIAEHLGAHARTLTMDGASVGDVIRRGRRRRTRRRTVVGVAAVATVGTATVATINVLSRPSDQRRISVTDNRSGDTDPSNVVTVPAAGDSVLGSIQPVPSNLVWNSVVPNSAEAIAVGGFGDTQTQPPYIMMTTAPGQVAPGSPGTPTMYGSIDAISWTPLGAQPGVPLTAFDAYDGSIYVFSTAAATAPIEPGGAGDAVITSSRDQGASWMQEILPLDLRAIAGARGVGRAPLDARSLAAGPAGVIAVVDVYVELDLAALGIDADGAQVNYESNGVSVVHDPCLVPATTTAAPNPAVTSVASCSDSSPDTIAPTSTFYSWTDLDLAPAVAAELTGPPHVFVQRAGESSLTEVAFPDDGGGRIGNATAIATHDGFAITATVASDDGSQWRNVIATSTDAATWTIADIPLGVVSTVGQLDDGTFVIVGATTVRAQGAAVATSADGVNFSITELDGLLSEADGKSASLMLPTASSAAIGSSGITIVANITTDPFVEDGPATLSKDGITVSMINSQGDLVFSDDATGAELGSLTNSSVASRSVTYDGGGNVELVADDGSTLFTLTALDQDNLYGQRYEPGGQPRVAVLHSDDGVTWSREDLTSIAGFDTSGARVQSAGKTVIVTVLDSRATSEDQVSKTVVLVGTPAT
jgi:hypothetical protein